VGIGPEGDSTKIPRSALSLGRLNFWKTRVQKQSSVRQFLLRLNNSSGSLLAEDFEICHSALFCLVRFCTETTEAQFEPSFGELEETNRNWINVKIGTYDIEPAIIPRVHVPVISTYVIDIWMCLTFHVSSQTSGHCHIESQTRLLDKRPFVPLPDAARCDHLKFWQP